MGKIISANVKTLGEVADFGNEIYQPCTKLELKTKININRVNRHFAKRVLYAAFYAVLKIFFDFVWIFKIRLYICKRNQTLKKWNAKQ